MIDVSVIFADAAALSTSSAGLGRHRLRGNADQRVRGEAGPCDLQPSLEARVRGPANGLPGFMAKNGHLSDPIYLPP